MTKIDFIPVLEAQKCWVNVPDDVVPGEGSLPGVQTSCCVLTQPFLGT